jgi:hypothetical protein
VVAVRNRLKVLTLFSQVLHRLVVAVEVFIIKHYPTQVALVVAVVVMTQHQLVLARLILRQVKVIQAVMAQQL